MVMSADPNAPPSGPDLVARKVGTLFGHSLGFGSEKRLDLLSTTDAHRSYLCDLERATEDVLVGARFTGWRYVVLYREEALLVAEVGAEPVNGAWRVISALASPFLAEEFRDLLWLAKQPEVSSGDFEICFLRVPGGVVRAWWLRGIAEDRSQDLLLPVQPSHPELRRNDPVLLRPGSFRGTVAAIARYKLAQGSVLLRNVSGSVKSGSLTE